MMVFIEGSAGIHIACVDLDKLPKIGEAMDVRNKHDKLYANSRVKDIVWLIEAPTRDCPRTGCSVRINLEN